MKTLKLVGLLALVLMVISCKKDRDAEEFDALVGHWHVSSFQPTSVSELSTASIEVIAQLVTAGCFPLEYSFGTSGKVSHIDKMEFLEVTIDEQGVSANCLFDNIFEDGIFSISNNVLTLNYDNKTVVLDIAVTEDTLTVFQSDFILLGEKITGNLIFSREDF